MADPVLPPRAPYGRDTTTQFRPFDYAKPQRRYDSAADPDEYSGLIDSYRDGYLGAIGNYFEREMAGGTAPKGWDPLDHVPEGYEDYTKSFMFARTPEMLETVRRQIDERLALGARRERRGFMSTMGSDLVAGIFDPSNLIVGPALKGAGFLAGTAKGALFAGSMGAGQEAVVWGLEPGIQPDEGKARVVGGAVGGAGLGGILGGVIGGVTSRAAGSAAPGMARQISRGQIINYVLHDLEGGDKIVPYNPKDGGKTKYGIAQVHNPEIADVGTLTYEQAAAHAQKKYWKPEFDKVDPRIAAIAFDAHYINSIETAHKILKATSVEEALRIYRNQLNWIADNVEGKAKYRKGWNNRVNKLAKFVGGADPSQLIAGARQPRGVTLDGRGYIKIRNEHTGIYDKDGNYVPAAWVKKRKLPTDDNMVVAMDERPGRYETLERQASHQKGQKKPVFEMPVPEKAATINRPRVSAAETEADVMPRGINDDVDAAIRLDQLERGDAEAARIMQVPPRAPEQPSPRFSLWNYTGQNEDGSYRFTHVGETHDVPAKDLTREQQRVIEDASYKDATENLPFTLEQAAKSLPPEDAAFLSNTLEAKGLVWMSQPELDTLAKIIAKLPEINPEAAKMWMGKNYKGEKLTPYDVSVRLEGLVAHRKQLAEMAPQYERDVAPFDIDHVRDQLDLAMDEAVYMMGKASDELEAIRLEKKAKVAEQVDDLHPNMPGRKQAIVEIKKAWNAEYENAISLAKERRWRIQDRIEQLKQERNKHFGQQMSPDGDPVLGYDRWAPDHKAYGEPPEDLKAIWAADKEKQRLAEFSSSELRNMIQEKQSELMDMERGQQRWYGREKVTEPFSTKLSKGSRMSQADLFKLKTKQMNDLINRMHEVESLEKELDDYLPFRVPERGGLQRAEDIDNPDGEYIAIDVESLLASFPQKPWMQSVHGLPGMSEDAFQTAEEWVNFVFLHEREHVQNPRASSEDIGTYEKRINDRALTALKSEDLPWKPVDGWKQRLVLAPTPIGQLMRIVTNPLNYMWKSIAVIGSDYDLRLQRNLVEGGASQDGGSVFQRTMRHTARAAEFFHVESNHYLEYATGKQSDWGSVGVAYSVWRTSKKAAGMDKMTWEEFDRAVGQVQISGKPSGIKQVDASAALFNEIVEDVRKQAEEMGILPGKESAEAEANALRSTINSLEQLPNRGPKGDEMLLRLHDDLARAEFKAKQPSQTPGTKGLPYFTRVWNPAALIKNPDEIKRIFREAYQRQGDSIQEAAEAAELTYQKLIEDPTSQSIEVSATAGEFRSREIPVENDEVQDFIHQDAHIILARYLRHTGGAIEMTRAFGDPAGLLEENRIYAALEADGLSEGKIQAALQIWQDVRDRIIGGFHGENPMSTSNRLIRFAKRWTRTATMGMSGITQLTDLTRAMWVTGPNSFAKGMFSPMFSQMAGVDPGKYAKAVGESLEVEMGLMARRMMDDDDWTMRITETGIEKLMGDLDVPFFILNGVTPFTNMIKRGVARAVPHLTIDRARRVTEAIHAGKAPPADDATWLREHGIDEHDAQLLVKLPVEETKGGFIMADLDEWAALGPEGMRGKDLVMGVISGHTRRAVATPGPLNRPRIMDGIMINKKERSRAWADRWAAEQAEMDARSYVHSLRQQGFKDGDPEFDAAVNNMVQAAGVHKRAQLNTGSKGRKERPFLSLPFQLQSFAFSQSAKLTNSILSGRDKNVLLGVSSMWATGIMVSWLKGEIAMTNDNATFDEHVMRGLQNSGIFSWMSIPIEAAKGLASLTIGEVNLGPVNVIKKDMPGLTDQTGVLGPSINLGMGAIEALFGKNFDGKDLPPSQRVYQLRKILPFGNLLYWNWLVRIAADAAVPEGEMSKQAVAQNSDDEYGKTIEGMMGFTYGDVDPRSPLPEVANSEDIAMKAIDMNQLLAGMHKQKKGQRAPKVGDTMAVDKFGQPSSAPPAVPVTKGKKQRAPKVGDQMVIDKFK